MATAVLPLPKLDYTKLTLYDGPNTTFQPSMPKDSIVSGLPDQYEGERVWTGASIAAQDTWLTTLSDNDLQAVTRALRHFQGLGLTPQHLSRETFPLPQELQAKLRKLSYDCHVGRGFAVLRGLCPEHFSESENVLVFGGISSHVAPVRGFQDVKRESVSVHVVSEENRPGASEHKLKPAFTNGRLAFHTDIGDLLTLYTIEPAEHGGNTVVVSSSQIYNELALARPDLVKELSKPWVYYSDQDYNATCTPLILNAEGNRLVLQFSRLPITGFRNCEPNTTLPTPTAKRLEAMSMVESLAWQNCFRLPGHRGDIAFINNLTLLHARESFDLDAEGKAQSSKRHLVKLMLRDPELAWKLPESLLETSHMVYGPNQDNGARSESWQLTVDRGDTTREAAWAGDGVTSNG